MLSNSKQVHYEVKSLHVPTPRWRILEIDSTLDDANTAAAANATKNETDEQIEPLDDMTFINRHKLKELKERDITLKFKNNKIDHKEKKNKSKSSTSTSMSLSLPNEPSTSAILMSSSS
jgi:hypothetical protein